MFYIKLREIPGNVMLKKKVSDEFLILIILY